MSVTTHDIEEDVGEVRRMTVNELEELLLEFAQFALDETWSDVEGRAMVLAQELSA